MLDQFEGTRIGDLNGPVVVHQLAIGVAGEQQIGLGGKGSEATARTGRGVKEQARRREIAIDQELEKLGGGRNPFGAVLFRLRGDPHEDHPEILGAKGIPALGVQNDVIDVTKHRLWNGQSKLRGRPQRHAESVIPHRKLREMANVALKYFSYIDVAGDVLDASHPKQHVQRIEHVAVRYGLVRLRSVIQMVNMRPPAEFRKPAAIQPLEGIIH